MGWCILGLLLLVRAWSQQRESVEVWREAVNNVFYVIHEQFLSNNNGNRSFVGSS